MRIWVAVVTMAAFMVAGGFEAWGDKKSERVRVRGSKVLRGSSEKRILAIDQKDLCRPGLTDEELVKTFIRVSEVGGTALCFDLEGFSADGSALDADYVATVVRIKDAANARWMPTVMRVLGSLEDADHRTRLNAVRTAAAAFADNWSILYWIDGPKSGALAKAFRKEASKLAVLSSKGGDVDVVRDPGLASRRRPALLIGRLPADGETALHCVLPDDEASYEALEVYRRLPFELEPWYPSTVGLSKEEVLDGWVVLFNGRSLDGWAATGWNPEGFIAKDGMIVRDRRGGDSLRTRDRYDNFALRLEWKIDRRGGNSGIFLRAPRENRESKMGFEFQIMGDFGEEAHKNGTGAVYDVVAPSVNASQPAGHWNDLEIRLDGPHFRATLNGVIIQDLNFDEDDELRHRLRNGFIALQDHGSAVAFRNIRIKRL